MALRELCLCAGAGGGILGGVLLGWRTVCAVESDPLCRQILFARQLDGCLGRFPIWDRIETFDGRPWRGQVDVITCGYPCPRWSTARRGRGDTVDLWPHARRIVAEARPRYVVAENVQRDPIERSAAELVSDGYAAVVCQASAASVGAPHDRLRWWAVGRLPADPDHALQPAVPLDAQVARLQAPCVPIWRRAPPHRVLGMADGVAPSVDRAGRMRAIGNGQVPAVVCRVWRQAMKVLEPTE